MRAIALDSERPSLDVIDAFCYQLDAIELVKTFTQSGEARLYLAANPVDLIFLDAYLPNESGLSFFISIAQPTLAIFTTAHSEYAVESYEVEAVDYLLKPFTFERFGQAVQRAQTRWQAIQPPYPPARSGAASEDTGPAHLYVRVNYSSVKVLLANIRFVEGLDNYLKIHLSEGQPLVVRLTIKALLDRLPPEQFRRVHRSYVVAVDKITALRRKTILINQDEIPIGSQYENALLNLFRT